MRNMTKNMLSIIIILRFWGYSRFQSAFKLYGYWVLFLIICSFQPYIFSLNKSCNRFSPSDPAEINSIARVDNSKRLA